MAKNDDLANEPDNPQTIIVKDEKAALRLKREETKEAQARYKAIVAKERAERDAERALRREEIQLELAKIRLNTSASEKARTNLAVDDARDLGLADRRIHRDARVWRDS